MPMMREKELAGWKDRQFVTSLARGLEILRAFRPGETVLGNQSIANRTGLPKPTVARLTHTLTELGYLEHDRRSRTYGLRISLLSLGHAALSNMDVRGIARPAMQELAGRANALVALAARDRLTMLLIECCRPADAYTSLLTVGTRVPIHQTAVGRAYLAGLPEAERSVLLDRIRERRGGPAAVAAAEEGIGQVLREGFCVSVNERVPELVSLAAPLPAARGGGAHAVTMVGAVAELTPQRIAAELGPRLVALAARIQAERKGPGRRGSSRRPGV